jgi:hypothetical protein
MTQSSGPTGSWRRYAHPTGRHPRPRCARALLVARWNAPRAARLGAIENALDHPSLLAEESGRLVGVATDVVSGAECELLTLYVDERRRGVGSRLADGAAGS